VDGHVDLLGVPQVAFKGRVALERIAVDRLAAITARHGLSLAAGTVALNGQVEYASHIKLIDLEEIRVDGVKADYTYHKGTARAVKETAEATTEATKEMTKQSDVVVKARRLSVHGATVGFVNEQGGSRYRVFLADTDLVFENFSNRFTQGTASASLTGRFMGRGATAIHATFRPEMQGADFDVAARIEDTDLTTMNDLLRAHAKVDVVSGAFSVFAEAHVKNARVQGYVKPLFRDVRLYGAEQDAQTSLGHRLKERAADVIAKVLRNRPRREVATVAPFGGPLENPRANTWEALVGLVRNAFSKTILPGFEREQFGL
jgi:hypothetical protein